MSEDAKTTPKAPRGIGTAGRKLWNDIVKDYDLRADELRVLAKACALEDHIAALQKGLEKAPLTVTGSQGQEVINHLYTEIRQQMSTQATLLRQLKLADADEEAAQSSGERTGPMSREESARKAAKARWSRKTAS